MKPLSLIVCLVVAAATVAVLAADPPATRPAEHLDITLRNTRWQPLPQGVYRVHVGLDDRVWYELDAPAASADPAVLKAMVEREFHREAPQLYGATPVFFEPKGCVWFRGWGALQRTVFGYDGKTWIERPLQPNRSLHGALLAGGVAFFIDTLGVEQYDGTQWTYRAFYTRPPKPPTRPLLEVEPDGKGVVALINSDTPELWRWRDGKWAQAAAPGPLGRFSRFAPVEGGIVTLALDGDLRFRPYDPDAPGAFAAIIKQLDHDDPAVRDQAANALTGMGESVVPALEKLLGQAQSPESITRLQKILADLRAGARPPYYVFGPYRVGKIYKLEYLADRTLCLAAGAIADAQGKELGPGVIVRPPQAEPRFLAGEAVARAFDYNTSDLNHAVLAGKSARLWLPPVTRSGAASPASLVDLKEGKVLANLPDPRCRILHAARADGTLFASPDLRSNIMVFTPGAEDQRNFLETQERSVAGRTIGVATDGAVYAITEGLSRFDGKTWIPVGVFQRDTELNGALAGTEGVMLFKGYRSCALVAGGKRITAPNVQTLITENRDAITKAFAAADLRGNYHNALEAVVVDAAKNVWLLDNGKLTVLAGDRWLDTQVALKAAGSPAGFVHFVSTVGDASKVYVTDFTGNGRGVSALGEVRDGAVVFNPADRTDDRDPTFLTVRDPAGALWLPVTWRVKPTDGVIGGRWATRFTEKGIDAQLKDAGWPALCDLDGNVWLAQGHALFKRVDRFALWRDGKIVHTLEVTAAGQHPRLYADRKGSVWAWTDGGLQHFVAPDRAKPWLYQFDKTYTPRDLTHPTPRAEFSALGYLVLITPNDPTPAQQHLYLVKLPGSP